MIEEHRIDTPEYSSAISSGISIQRPQSETVSLNKNRFTDSSIYWNRSSDSKAREIITSIAGRLKAGPILCLEVSGEPTIFSENYRVQIGANNFLIKRCNMGETEEFLAALNHTISFARENGVAAPNIIPIGDEGNMTLNINGDLWIAYEYVPAFSHFSGDVVQIYQAAFQIGKLNRALIEYAERFPDTVDKHFQAGSGGLQNPRLMHKMWHGVCRAVNRAETIDENRLLFSATIPDVHRALNEYSELFPELIKHNACDQMIHNDLHPHNVLMLREKGACLLDLHMMAVRSVYSEIAWAFYQIVKHSALETSEDNTQISREKLRTLGKFFEQGYTQGNPSAEWKPEIIYGYAMNECLTILLHHTSKIYVEGDKSWEFDLARHLDDISDVPKLMHAALGL